MGASFDTLLRQGVDATMAGVEGGMAWQSFVYQYGVMSFVFCLGLVLCWRQGDIGFSSSRRRRNLLLLVGGFVFFMGFQAVFQFAGPPSPAQARGTLQDRFFVRYFTPLGETAEKDNGWKMPMAVEGAWFYGASAAKQTVYRLEQEIDSGPPGNRFQKICPVFGVPLTDWHPEELVPFEERGFRFAEVARPDCQPACKSFEPESVESCITACISECAGHRIQVFRGRVE